MGALAIRPSPLDSACFDSRKAIWGCRPAQSDDWFLAPWLGRPGTCAVVANVKIGDVCLHLASENSRQKLVRNRFCVGPRRREVVDKRALELVTSITLREKGTACLDALQLLQTFSGPRFKLTSPCHHKSQFRWVHVMCR